MAFHFNKYTFINTFVTKMLISLFKNTGTIMEFYYIKIIKNEKRYAINN